MVSDSHLKLPDVFDDKNNLLVSDTALRSLIPPNIKYMTTMYKQMCGCEICIMSKSLQNDLNQYRLMMLRRLEKSCVDKEEYKIYKHSVYRYNIHLRQHIRNALDCIHCI